MNIQIAARAFVLLAFALMAPGVQPALAQDGETVRLEVYDPMTMTKGRLFERLENIDNEDFSDWGPEMQSVSAKMRADMEEKTFPADSYGLEFITSWDALFGIELQQQTILGVLQNAPQQVQQQQLSMARHAQQNPNGTVTTLPLHIAQILNVNILQLAHERLGTIESPIQVPQDITVTVEGACPAPNGDFDVVQKGVIFEVTDGDQIQYFGAATGKDLWLWGNVARYAAITTEKGVAINAPDGPGVVFHLELEGRGYVGKEFGDRACRATLTPAAP